jgi:hypothetical protein
MCIIMIHTCIGRILFESCRSAEEWLAGLGVVLEALLGRALFTGFGR